MNQSIPLDLSHLGLHLHTYEFGCVNCIGEVTQLQKQKHNIVDVKLAKVMEMVFNARPTHCRFRTRFAIVDGILLLGARDPRPLTISIAISICSIRS